jgi:hypothetical protein
MDQTIILRCEAQVRQDFCMELCEVGTGDHQRPNSLQMAERLLGLFGVEVQSAHPKQRKRIVRASLPGESEELQGRWNVLHRDGTQEDTAPNAGVHTRIEQASVPHRDRLESSVHGEDQELGGIRLGPETQQEFASEAGC